MKMIKNNIKNFTARAAHALGKSRGFSEIGQKEQHHSTILLVLELFVY